MAWYSVYSDAYAINENIDLSIFANRGSGQDNFLYMIVFGVVVAISLVLAFLYRYKNKRRMRRPPPGTFSGVEGMTHLKFNISKATHVNLEALAKASDIAPDKLLASNVAFEKAVAKLRKTSPPDPLLLKIPGLREDLGYTFSNRRNHFICTQMLPVGQKLRVSVKDRKRNHAYVGTILNTNEQEFWVTPPTVKGKTVDLSRFKSFSFSIFRKNDGEYRFRARSKSQISKPQNALVMHHASKIQKLHIRKVDRFKVAFELEFYFLITKHQPKDSNSKNESLQRTGNVVDISTSGLKFTIKDLPEAVAVGSNIMFRLNDAEIDRDVLAEIVKIDSENEHHDVHIQFLNLTELDRLYLQHYISSQNLSRI